MPEVPAWPGLVLNIGGQGEIAYAVDVNNLVSPTVDPELYIHSGRFIRADATALPVRSAVADTVKGEPVSRWRRSLQAGRRRRGVQRFETSRSVPDLVGQRRRPALAPGPAHRRFLARYPGSRLRE